MSLSQIQNFISTHGIHGVKKATTNPNKKKDWGTTYEVTLYKPGSAPMNTTYTIGSAIKSFSTADVLSALAMAALTVEDHYTFEQWADALGYDSDSRKAYAIFTAIEDDTALLSSFLGTVAFDELLAIVRDEE